MQVHNRNYFDLLRAISKQNSEREYFRETSLNIGCHNRVQTWVQYDTIDGVLHRSQESSAEIALLSFVIGCRFKHLGFSIFLKDDRFHVSEA